MSVLIIEGVNNELINTYLTHVDTVVFDAFSVGHRPHASVCGLMLQKQKSYVFGPLFEAEKKAIDQAMHGADPRLAIISGAKITSKLVVIKKMLAWADSVIVGGAIANTLLKAKGIDMGQSLIDHSALDIAEKLINTAGNKLILPIDGIDQDGCRHDFDAPLPGSTKLLDIGSKTCLEYAKYIDKAKPLFGTDRWDITRIQNSGKVRKPLLWRLLDHRHIQLLAVEIQLQLSTI